jgi:hypothetical protein
MDSEEGGQGKGGRERRGGNGRERRDLEKKVSTCEMIMENQYTYKFLGGMWISC